jgi:hypothetical protein
VREEGVEPSRHEGTRVWAWSVCHSATPARCAARGSNSALRVKSPVHHHNACSAWSRRQESNPHLLVGSQRPLPLDDDGVVALPAPESGSAGLRPAALPHELKSRGRGGGIRTRDYLVPSQVACQTSPHPSEAVPMAQWRWQESNPLRQRLQGVPATISCHPQVPAGWRLRALLGCSRC